MSLPDRISLQPTASEVGRLNTWLDAKFAESGIEKSLASDLKLCLNEVFANLISYAFKDTPKPEIHIAVKLRPGSAGATVLDNGDYFDIREFKAQEGRNLMSEEPGGFGIPLIKERASSIGYRRSCGYNRLDIACLGTIP